MRVSIHGVAVRVLAVLVVVLISAAAAEAGTLYRGETANDLYTVDQTTGASTKVGAFGTSDSFGGLSAREGDADLYGVLSPYTQADGTSSARLIEISTSTGAATAFPLFSEATLGFENPFATGIAISPTKPGVAVVAGFRGGDINDPGFGDNFLWNVDVSTGSVLGAAVSMSEWITALTFSLDGSTLYGAVNGGLGGTARLVTVDPSTGNITTIGKMTGASIVQGLAFRPDDGTLFAINAYITDTLITVDPSSGAVLSTIGSLGTIGPEGLAFEVVPEPATLLLVGVGLLPLLGRRRRRC